MLFSVLCVCLFLAKRQLRKMMLGCMRRLGGIISLAIRHSSHMVHTKQLCLYFAPQGQTWRRLQLPRTWGKKLRVSAQYCLLLTRAGLRCYSAHWKTISDKKGDVLYLKMYIKWCQQHPGGQSGVPMETESGCCAQRLDTPLSGGSVMALSFSRHVPGSFDTGNMHAGWQCLGCAAETMMYISFSSLTDWRL